MATLAAERAAARDRERRRLRESHAQAIAAMVGVASGRASRGDIAGIVAERRPTVSAEEIEATTERVLEILRERRGPVDTKKKRTRKGLSEAERARVRERVERALEAGQRPSDVIAALEAEGIAIPRPSFYTIYWGPAKRAREARIQGPTETVAGFPETTTATTTPEIREVKVTLAPPEHGLLARIDAELEAVEARRSELLAARRVVAELLAA